MRKSLQIRSLALLCLSIVTIAILVYAQPGEMLPYLDMSLPRAQRIDDLLKRMTLEEKISQLNYQSPDIDRLGIPAYNWWNECLHGVARAGKATVFPQAIGLAASWDTELAHRVAQVISTEARAKHHEFARNSVRGIYTGLTFFTPNINIFRDPRWGRGHETYGEDPYLTAQMAVNFIRGLQGEDPRYLKVGATAKHFAVHSGPEHNRHTFNVQPTEQDLWETYLPAFEATVKEANVSSLMCAYNRFRDEPCCGNDPLLGNILRDQWGFEGYVVSDCWAVVDFYMYHKVVPTPEEAAALALRNGTDLNCGDTYNDLPQAVVEGLIPEKEIDKALKRLLHTRFALGMFDDPEKVPYAQIPYTEVTKADHLDLALETSRKSVVLLKNEGELLPLSREISAIAVIGPNANNPEVLLGNYHGTPTQLKTPLEALKEKLGEKIAVNYALGSNLVEDLPTLTTIPSSALFTTENGNRNGLGARYRLQHGGNEAPMMERIDEVIDFSWYSRCPVNHALGEPFSVTWEGMIKAPKSGFYQIGFRGSNGVKLYFDHSLKIDFEDIHEPKTHTFNVHLQAGEMYPVRLEYFSFGVDANAKLSWAYLGEDLVTPAVEAARKSDVVVFFMGLSPRIEGEEMDLELAGFKSGDRTDILLPQVQTDLMKKVAALGKPMVLALIGGGAMAFPWENDHIPAVLYAGYPGECGGQAIADVLFGDYNPSGRLPVTFYRSIADLPEFENYHMTGRTYRFFEGMPLYPFGHGLSYTQFQYQWVDIPTSLAMGDSLEIKLTVANTGQLAGEEVAQLYFSQKVPGYRTPVQSLKGFKRIMLQAGEAQEVSFRLSPKQLSVVNNDGEYVQNPGPATIFVGGGQPDPSGFAHRGEAGGINKILTFE